MTGTVAISVRPAVASPGGSFVAFGETRKSREDETFAAEVENAKTYQLEVGDGNGYTIDVCAFQTSFRARDLLDAMNKAKRIIRGRAGSDRENTVRITDARGSLAWTPAIDLMREDF